MKGFGGPRSPDLPSRNAQRRLGYGKSRIANVTSLSRVLVASISKLPTGAKEWLGNRHGLLRRLTRAAALPRLAVRLLQHRRQKFARIAPRRFDDILRRTPRYD